MTPRGRLSIFAVSTIVILAIAVPLAHAGGGMGDPSDGLTTCRTILNGGNQPQVLRVTDSLTNAPAIPPDVVNVGVAAMVCDLGATAVRVSGPATTPPTFTAPTVVTCYAVGQADPSKVDATIIDLFGTHTVKLGGIQLFCVPSQVTIGP